MLKRLLTIRYVCKKYKIDYSLPSMLGLSKSAGFIITDDDGVPLTLGVHLFQKNFYEVLFHEVGHIVTCRRAKDDRFLKNHRNYHTEYDWFTRIEEEALASKFSIRVCNKIGNANVKYLEKCWHSYVHSLSNVCAGSPTLTAKLTDVVGKNSKIFWRNDEKSCSN